MRNSKGLGVVRLGDKTSHGGQVTTASSSFKVNGKCVALDGDMTDCPQCKGTYLIKVCDSERKHHGKFVAYEGDKATCGAKLLTSL